MLPELYNMNMDSVCRRLARSTTIPHGYNPIGSGVVVVHSVGSSVQNNMATIDYARAMFPTLVIVTHDGINYVVPTA